MAGGPWIDLASTGRWAVRVFGQQAMRPRAIITHTVCEFRISVCDRNRHCGLDEESDGWTRNTRFTNKPFKTCAALTRCSYGSGSLRLIKDLIGHGEMGNTLI
jgi:hypothetical protein